MKQLSTLVFCLLIWISFGCSKENSDLTIEQEVDNYISQLRKGEFTNSGLPDFNSKHIPYLLKYNNDLQVITNFPRNPISSYYEQECTIGLFALYTIESIRYSSLNSEKSLMRFPSLNSVLVDRSTGEYMKPGHVASQQIAAEAYSKWWEQNKLNDFTAFHAIDPLYTTPFRWH